MPFPVCGFCCASSSASRDNFFLGYIEMPSSKLVLLGVGGLEAVVGLYHFLLPTSALPSVVGRHLSVGAAQSSPALVPMIAQTGMLRLAMGMLLMGFASATTWSDSVHTLEAITVAYTCLLQPFSTVFRGHPRLPIGGKLLLSLLEGSAIVAAMAADASFDLDTLVDSVYFLVSAGLLVCGLLLALVACCMASGKGGAVAASAEEDPMAFKGSDQMPLFDEKSSLSPGARRLLS